MPNRAPTLQEREEAYYDRADGLVEKPGGPLPRTKRGMWARRRALDQGRVVSAGRVEEARGRLDGEAVDGAVDAVARARAALDAAAQADANRRIAGVDEANEPASDEPSESPDDVVGAADAAVAEAKVALARAKEARAKAKAAAKAKRKAAADEVLS